MRSSQVYSLTSERLSVERQLAAIRLLMSLTTSLLLLKFYFDQSLPGASGPDIEHVGIGSIAVLIALFAIYSAGIWAWLKWRPDGLISAMAISSVLEVMLIIYLLRSPAASEIPFYLWYVFYVASVAMRYGWRLSILALSASIGSFVISNLVEGQYVVQILSNLGFTAFLLVLAFFFGQISERQFNYQASLSIVNEFRAELAGLTTTSEIINHLLVRARDILRVEQAWFLPARRGADGSEAPGLRSAGADPVLLSTFREGGADWNVEEILNGQRALVSNTPHADSSLPKGVAARLGLKNLAAAPLIVGGIHVGVVYAANKKESPLSNQDLRLLELIATQAAPVVENALLWERLREAATSEERIRIARDLHDNFLQTLAAIKLHLERCKLLVQKDTTRALDGIDKIHQIASRGLGEVRAYLSELRVMGPEPSRFRQAIERASAEAATKAGFKTHLEVHLPDECLPPNVALAAFQILRELLNNAASHSGAEHVQVRVFTEEGNLVLEIEDDGKGFDVASVRAEKASQGHLGLVGVEERAKQSNGTLTVTSQPGKGTRATAYLALQS
ncbi:MAG: sensor histidine kinase [Armatimonadetes bacterium]|nr:sensor histidine kinase [Armatimonadota bacterium]